MQPKIIIPEDLFLKLKSGQDGPKHCYGLTRPDESLVQILSLEPKDDLKRVAHITTEGIELEETLCLVSFSEMEIIHYDTEFTARSRDLIDTNTLAGMKVTFIGLGSVGSQMALQLAQSALGQFSLLDPDKLSASNLSRHACGMTDLGRFKTKAVRDLILSRNPQALIKTYDEDFLALTWTEQAERLMGADLVVASTDSTPVQFMVNEGCHHLQIPSLYVGCYERACAGEVLFVIPGKTACFNCFMEFRQSYLTDLKKKEKSIPYINEAPAGFKAEPGLAIDIAHVVAIACAYALALLLPDSARGKLLDPERNLILAHSGNVPEGRYGEIFHQPFDFLGARVKRDSTCLVCQVPVGGIDETSTELG